MVGEGNAFKGYDFPVLSRGSIMPSGGFGFRVGPSLFKEDIKRGLLRDLFDMYKTLRSINADIVISVGDPFNLIFTHLGTKKDVFFISTDQGHSAWVNGFNRVELELIKRYTLWTFVRDRKTEEFFKKRGFRNVSYLGNPLMDTVGEPKFLMEDGITLLPGTRRDSGRNLLLLLDIVREIKKRFKYYIPVNNNSEQYIVEALDGRYTLLDWEYGYRVESPVELYIGKGIFPEMVSSSILVIGLSGSGNEQSAGLGKPVVSFYIDGIQFNRKFISEQKKLLGDSLILSDRESVGSIINSLLDNPQEIERRGEIGKIRMGERGAIERIAQFISGYKG